MSSKHAPWHVPTLVNTHHKHSNNLLLSREKAVCYHAYTKKTEGWGCWWSSCWSYMKPLSLCPNTTHTRYDDTCWSSWHLGEAEESKVQSRLSGQELTVPAEDPSSVPSTQVRWLTLPSDPAPGHPIPTISTCTHRPNLHPDFHILINLKIKKKKTFWKRKSKTVEVVVFIWKQDLKTGKTFKI